MHVALVGVTGYSGMVLYQLLQQHPEVNQVDLYGHKNAKAQSLATAVPQFIGSQAMIEPFAAEKIMAVDQVIFFATSAGVTTELAKPFIAANFPVIDLSGDYRLRSRSSFKKWYHKEAPDQAALQQAHYGLAEFHQASGQTYIANPGCYATATLLGLAPLVQQGLIEPDSIIVDAKSGTSGAGKKLAANTHFTQTNENLQVYKVNQHQHIPEIMQQLQEWNSQVPAIQFTTTLLPITRGIMSSIFATVKQGVTTQELQHAFQDTYQEQPFVRIFTEQLPTLKQVIGTNFCDIGVVFNPVTQKVFVVSVIDNLLKGAGGQAIQNFNQLFSFPIASGLPQRPMLP
ncbi:N-acetyl-gamma-glutamyl-phosphate reductase [Loigolactobacillus iwatensis]|uniref:N-acetyl-gamma-glutamyl-phosphate reductase n=1 Tax=Loigolactobacillus iwatensis TaxID=1267156 RepID=UPI000F7DF1B4|nr:N-acetyl-gamma-glutamyl-phosphate reductase [Loigolactobacillus iwatensis]